MAEQSIQLTKLASCAGCGAKVGAEAQKRGGEVAFVDAEHALDPVYAAAIGVDIDSMLVSQPFSGLPPAQSVRRHPDRRGGAAARRRWNGGQRQYRYALCDVRCHTRHGAAPDR